MTTRRRRREEIASLESELAGLPDVELLEDLVEPGQLVSDGIPIAASATNAPEREVYSVSVPDLDRVPVFHRDSSLPPRARHRGHGPADGGGKSRVAEAVQQGSNTEHVAKMLVDVKTTPAPHVTIRCHSKPRPSGAAACG